MWVLTWSCWYRRCEGLLDDDDDDDNDDDDDGDDKCYDGDVKNSKS